MLAQQIVAETAAEEEWDEDALFALFQARLSVPQPRRRRNSTKSCEMLARGYATRRGRRGALIHHDSLNHKLRARKGSRMSAIINGGAIPEVFDYRVLLEPEGHFIGTLNEDFAIESLPGDVFQLGNTSWRILRIGNGVVRVADAQGQPPSMPFWLGEAPARSDEMSVAVSQLRAAVDFELPGPDEPRKDGELEPRSSCWSATTACRARRPSRSRPTSAEAKRSLGVVPTADAIALERFFDESGGMQLVLHAPFGSRINRAWGLALRKKFCQGFNFELQAAATEEGIILSLGEPHSFPLEEVFRYLHPNTVRETLVQAVLQSPIFETRWRWSTTLALAVPRNRGGARVPNQLQRMYAEDLLQAVFPDAVGLPGQHARARARFPTIRWSTRRCATALEEAVDVDRPGSRADAARQRRDRAVSRATRRSLGAQPRAAEFRGLHVPRRRAARGAPHARRVYAPRDRAAQRRRSRRARSGGDRARARGSLAGREHRRRDVRRADGRGYIDSEAELAPHWPLAAANELGRAGGQEAATRGSRCERKRRRAARDPRAAGSKCWARSRAASCDHRRARDIALLALEAQGRILRGPLHAGTVELEWCDRAPARAHPSLHAEPPARRDRAGRAPPTSCASCSHWQHVAGEDQVTGAEGLARGGRAARRLRARGGRLGERRAAGARRATTRPSSSTGCA